MSDLVPVLTPRGHFVLAREEGAPALSPEISRRLQQSFAHGPGHGLLQLGAGEVGTAMPPLFGYWRELGASYVTAVCTMPDIGELGTNARVPAPSPEELESLAAAAPPMTGA